jgi:exosome complex RNA-binding protein Csl4
LRYTVDSIVVPGDRLGTITLPVRQSIKAGKGTYIQGGHLYASVVGRLTLTRLEQSTSVESVTATVDGKRNDTSDREEASWMVSVTLPPLPRNINYSIAANDNDEDDTLAVPRKMASDYVISVGQVVLASVWRITSQQATLQIRAIDQVGMLPSFLGNDYPEGILRREDITHRVGVASPATPSATTPSHASLASAATTTLPRMQDSCVPGDLVLCRVLALGSDVRRYTLTTAEPALGVLYATCRSSGQPMVPLNYRTMVCPDTGVTELRKCAQPRPAVASTRTNKTELLVLDSETKTE